MARAYAIALTRARKAFSRMYVGHRGSSCQTAVRPFLPATSTVCRRGSVEHSITLVQYEKRMERKRGQRKLCTRVICPSPLLRFIILSLSLSPSPFASRQLGEARATRKIVISSSEVSPRQVRLLRDLGNGPKVAPGEGASPFFSFLVSRLRDSECVSSTDVMLSCTLKSIWPASGASRANPRKAAVGNVSTEGYIASGFFGSFARVGSGRRNLFWFIDIGRGVRESGGNGEERWEELLDISFTLNECIIQMCYV